MDTKNKIIIALFVLAVISVVIWFVNDYQKKERRNQTLREICITHCRYSPATNLWEYRTLIFGESRDFPSQEQCIEYCVLQLKEFSR